jgi:tight adherence protein B
VIVMSVALAGVAGFLFFRQSVGQVLPRRLAPVVERSEATATPGARRITLVLIIASAIGLPVLMGSVFGPRGVGLSLPAMIITGTVLLLSRRGARRRRAMRTRREVAHACSVLAAQLRIGQVPITALRSVADDCPVLRPAVATADLGGDFTAQWFRQSTRPGQAGLADLARAWRLAERTGAGMAETLDDVAEALAQDEDLSLLINSEAAGPRASGRMMALLPLAGIVLGYFIGGDPVAFLLTDPYGWTCLTGGALLACAGVLWMERVADRAAVEE